MESAITAAAGTSQPPMVQCPSCGRTFPVPKLQAALLGGCLNYPVGDDGQYPRAYQLNGWLPHEQDERKKQCLRNLSSDEAIEIQERPLPDTVVDIVQHERKDENQYGGYHGGRAVQHVDTTHPWFSMFEACQTKATSFDDVQLRRLITEQLVSIALLSEPSGPVYHNELRHELTMKQRMQAMFNQCADFPLVEFDLRVHPVEDWMKLVACAIRCTLMPCVRGFVFVGFQIRGLGHAVLFYFDGNEQYCFDPSGFLTDHKCANGQTILEYFKTHHVWIPHPPSHLLHLVDADDMCLSTTCLNQPTPTRKKTKLENPEGPVPMPWLQMTFGPVNCPDPLDLRGCCVTMTLLVVLFSLRYGCRNPNFMVKALRCAALDLQTMNPSLYEVFLQRLRGWQNKGTDFNTKPDDFQTLLLMNQCHNGRCNYMVYQPNGSWTLCPNPCSENSAWCANPTHGPKEKRLPGRDRPWNADLNIPLCVGTVGVVGHFDELWNATQEDCAMETMQSQLEELKNNQPKRKRGMIYANMPRCILYGCDEILGDFAKVLGTCQQDDKSEPRLLEQAPRHKHKNACGACDDRTTASHSIVSCDLITLAT